jgi:DNA-directed RNA polymerase specialized sigma24 family protein
MTGGEVSSRGAQRRGDLSFERLEERVTWFPRKPGSKVSAVECLPARCRKVFSLSRLGGVRHREIARRYGISLRLVERQITRAKAAINRG